MAAYSKRNLWYREDGKEPVLVELHNTDAIHALDVDPEHWSTDKADTAPIEFVPAEPTGAERAEAERIEAERLQAEKDAEL
jgi:hypothetical protein